ncbi:MAG: thermonuclease family protein [Pseudomonadota bacterium]
MRSIAKTALFALAALAISAASPAFAADTKSIVISSPDVIDGQTFEDESGRVYRLYAVRAPGLDAECENSDGEVYACGERARAVLEDYANGMLSCFIGENASDGVPTVRCTDFANRDLGSRLVRAGWALPDRTVSQAYVFDELEAEARRSGMWDGRFTFR